MSRFTHTVCDTCFLALYPDGRTPVRLGMEVRTEETCCRCGTRTWSGIYVRGNPDEYRCKGEHPEDAA